MGSIGHIEYKDKIRYYDKRANALIVVEMNDREQWPIVMKSKLYGYGGGEFASCWGQVFYVNKTGFWQGEQCIAKGIFGDLVAGDLLVYGILEKDNACHIFRYDVEKKVMLYVKRPEGCLASNIVLCPGNEARMVFIEWHKKWMPWDQSHLVLYDGSEQVIKNPYGGNIQQVVWVDHDTLVMIAQVENWWNLVSYHIPDRAWKVLVPRQYDCLVPLWGRSDRTLGVHERTIFFCEQQEQRHILQTFDMDQNILKPVQCPLTHIESLCACTTGHLLVKGGDPHHTVALWHSKHQWVTDYQRLMPNFNLQKIGDSAFAWLYEMKHHQAIVIAAHGGPTGQHALVGDEKIATLLFNQISVCALDYHGSTGRGERFRNSIYGQWGQVDVDDCVALIKTIQTIFPNLPIFLKGNSAGAMTCLLAASKIRISGVFMRYPVLNLSALLKEDALFEGHYLKRLLPKSLYALDLVECAIQAQCPLLIQQGDEDPVVCVHDVSQAVKRLSDTGAHVQYVKHSGQGHGFCSPASLVEAQNQELEFIRRWSQHGSHLSTES